MLRSIIQLQVMGSFQSHYSVCVMLIVETINFYWEMWNNNKGSMCFHHWLIVWFLMVISYCILWHQLMTIDHGYVPLVVSASRSIPHS